MFVSRRRIQKIKSVLSQRQDGLVVILEDTHDPYNAEAVCRSCEAFGVQNVHFIFENHPRYNPWKKGKAVSASANKWLTLHTHPSTRECLMALKTEGYKIIATLPNDADAEDIFQCDFSRDRIALVLGAEREGISEIVKSMADRKITIPMSGMVQSLNLSVTAAILLFEITRQRKNSGKSYTVPIKTERKLIKHYIGREYARVFRKPFKRLSDD